MPKACPGEIRSYLLI